MLGHRRRRRFGDDGPFGNLQHVELHVAVVGDDRTGEEVAGTDDVDETAQFVLGTDGAVKSMSIFAQDFRKDEGGRMKDESKR